MVECICSKALIISNEQFLFKKINHFVNNGAAYKRYQLNAAFDEQLKYFFKKSQDVFLSHNCRYCNRLLGRKSNERRIYY